MYSQKNTEGVFFFLSFFCYASAFMKKLIWIGTGRSLHRGGDRSRELWSWRQEQEEAALKMHKDALLPHWIIRQQASGFGRRALFVASDVHACHRSQEPQQLLAEAHK